MIKDFLKSLLFVFVCAFCVFSARAAVSLFSDYGQIQNVQTYSSNPFWSPTAPYNQRLPQPVYATGADLNANDCIQVVQSLVSVQCMARANCKNTDLSDIRPTVMVQLSNLPGANYVSACSGYIDGIFETYQKQYGNALPNRAVAFPNETTPNPTVNDSNGIQFENPYKQQPTKWQIEQKERSDELQRLQSQNGVGSEHLTKTDFPATYADLSFSERMENDRAGIMPYKDAIAYRTLDVKSTEEWCAKDGEHYNSFDCLKWRCSENGRETKTETCISFRCSDSDYYAKHQEECKRNELCSKNKTSDECMRYRCYIDPDQNFEECKKWKCQNDTDFKAENEEYCNPSPVDPAMPDPATTECTPADPHAIKGELDSEGNCKITECEQDWRPNADRTACLESGIVMAMYYETENHYKPKKCYDRCGIDNTDDGLTRTLRESGLLASDKSVCTIAGDANVYYEDDVTKEFVVPKSKKKELQIAINRIKNSNKYDCWPHTPGAMTNLYLYILLKDEYTREDIDGQKLYIIKNERW